MDPHAAATATAPVIADVASYFMLDMATYVRGGELGFQGLDFYTCGRGGALGDVPGDVVAASFVFWTPKVVTESWDRGRKVMSPAEAAGHFASVGHLWAESHLTAEVDLDRTAALLGSVVAGASSAGAPLFAAWRAVPEPDPERSAALVLHRINVLRELRGALHGAAVLGHGLDLHLAVSIGGPGMLGLYGYDGPHPDADDPDAKARWKEAYAATQVAVAPSFAGLDEPERDELVALLLELYAPFAG